jgi:hypothetical protein
MAGLIAALITAVCPALVSRASNVIVDTFATFFALLALYFCERMRSNTSSKVANSAAAGLAAGLAFASKYTAGAVFIAVLALIFALPVTRSSRARFALLASAGLVIGIALGAPATILNPFAVVRAGAVTADNYDIINSVPGYFGQAISAPELGWPLVIAGAAGIALMFSRKPTRYTALSWFLFAGLLLAVFTGKPFQPFRNLLPLVPLLCVAAAIAFSALIDWTRTGLHSWPRFGLTAALIGACIFSLGFSSFRQVQRRMAQRDSRIQAIDWLQRHAAKEETVLGVRELSILPAEWRRVPAHVTIVSWVEALDLLEQQRFDHVVTGDFDLRFTNDPNTWSVSRDRWKTKVSTGPVLADFGQVANSVLPYLWRTTDERILILKGNAP